MKSQNVFKLLLVSLISMASFALQIKGVDYSKQGSNGVVTVNFSGVYKGTPEITVKDKIVQVAVPQTTVWPKVEKKVTVNEKFDSTLMAYQYNKNISRVRMNLPYSVKGQENKVSVVMNDNNIKMIFPVLKTSKQLVQKVVGQATSKKNVAKTNYDESYLDKLLKEKEENLDKDVRKLDVAAVGAKLKDSVKTKSSSVAKSSFDFSNYVFKFVGFFALLIAGIYFMMNFFRKGVLKKGTLGLFSNAKMVEVVSTTFIAPKRSILVVRVHNQFFLCAQSEKGMDFLTEITDTTAFLKEGEKNISGSNFDTNLADASDSSKEFKIKEVTTQLEETGLEKVAQAKKDRVSLSSQIKKKVKDLKQLQ